MKKIKIYINALRHVSCLDS